MSSMLFFSCLQLFFFKLDFPDNMDASTNYLAKAGLLAGGLLLWQFRVGQKKKLNQSTKHKTAKQITHWLVSHIPLRLLIRLYPWLSACWSTDGRTGCWNTSLAHSSAGKGIPSTVGEYFLGNLSSTYQSLSTAEAVFLFLKQDLKEIISDFQYFFQISYSLQNTEQS